MHLNILPFFLGSWFCGLPSKKILHINIFKHTLKSPPQLFEQATGIIILQEADGVISSFSAFLLEISPLALVSIQEQTPQLHEIMIVVESFSS